MDYEFLKFIHIIFASIWFGVATYNLILKIKFAGSNIEFNVLKKFLEIVNVNNKILLLPSSILQLITGLGLAHLAMFSLSEFWIIAGIVIWVILAASIHFSAVATKKIIKQNEHSNVIPLVKSLIYMEIINFLCLDIIFFLMVYKPTLD